MKSPEISFEIFQPDSDGVPVKAWTRGVPFEEAAKKQVFNVAGLSIVGPHVAVMPDVHAGIGATVGSVIPTIRAIIPAAVGVDIGCGMLAARTTLKAEDLPDDLRSLREAIEAAVPHGFSSARAGHRKGGWLELSKRAVAAWQPLERGFKRLTEKFPHLEKAGAAHQLGTLGGGNHFIEVCLDEEGGVWILLHSGSRGIGNRIGTFFIELAREDMGRHLHNLPDRDLAYLEEGSEHFRDYVEAVDWAQSFALGNREAMLEEIAEALRGSRLPPFRLEGEAVNCHHNYVEREFHFGRDLWVTRKGAVRARQGELGIIPGSMGARSYIVRGLGNKESFESCSHGAGRAMSRGEARRRFTAADHARMTEGVECRKDKDVVDETPAAYKDIDAVMEAQKDLVEVAHTLKQVVCVKG